MRKHLLVILTLLTLPLISIAQETVEELKKEIETLNNRVSDLRHSFNSLEKSIDDIYWYDRVGDAAYVDKVILTGPKPRVEKNPTAQGAGNPLKFYTYIFIPKGIDTKKKYPLLVFPHGGVHSNFNTYYTHIIKELVAQKYIVVAPDYRGSTGYGKGFYEQIDYGGLEIQDTKASRDYMIENYSFIDESRVGIMGWSHGGLITLMNIFEFPESYKVAYSGVPVSDLVARMGYKTQRYRELYSADYHIGKSAYADVDEYRKRSPAWNAHKLQTPLLIHTNTNDEDVNVLEVEHLIKSLKAENKKFEYEIYEDMPGGHAFDRLDTKKAKEIRLKVYKFLNGYLKPESGFKTLAELEQAAYTDF
ncbi:alpha/beta hydrolase family protein [Chondrinema litorale]|uniref:alpha/beta hydrolase family protein n=1 Tax=Chondrinema litorale TaxID=2994555 RepID=UPI002543C12A|nr:prolyl oligopeptidase family serine peptidase [Chondrinema litorale]UZR93946.1 prolyl oligopeptidase family serine peptidase [Chondrinema litorale]